MKVTSVVAAALLLLLLLTGLSFRAVNRDAELFDRMLGALDRFTMIENALQRDVLSARIGVLRNYDPLVRETNELTASLLLLREIASVDTEMAATLDRLAASVASQEAMVEQFKSNNALLQNSLAYFGMYNSRLGASNVAGPDMPSASGLVSAMLHLTLNTSPMAVEEVETWLNELARQQPPSGHTASVRALLAHGRLLHDLLPATDSLLKALRAVPQKSDRDAVRAMVLARQSASRTTARHSRLALYATSLLLVAVLLFLGMQLRTHALALHRRVKFERAIARLSTRLINARTNGLGQHVEHALAELAKQIGADRAYFIAGGAAPCRHVWGRNGLDFPAAWPDHAAKLVGSLHPTAEGIIHIPCVDQLPPAEAKETLVSAGLRSWVCVLTPGAAGDGSILGFDATRDGRIFRSEDLGLLRMGFDAVANAVRRDALEQAGARLEQRLQQSRRMETVGALTSGIAHNFNNIIAAILGYAEIAEARTAPGSQPAQDIAEIHRAGERARDLVDQILLFGRRRDTHREPVSVRELVAETASLLQVSLPPGITLTIHDQSGSAVIFGQRGQLQQVILNLCTNAAQAMDGVGRIRLESKVEEAAEPRSLSHGDLAPGWYVCIAVCDSGRGMDEAIRGRMFEPFFTTRLSGNGLGLATVREIILEHGGAMNVRSAPQAGSQFEAWLPCSDADTLVPAASSPLPPLGNGETVLVVDEERAQLLRDEEILAALGYEPVGFTLAEDALTACRAAPSRFDILVVGRLVPDASTLDVAAKLHAIAPNLPILLAAASVSKIGANVLLAAGISDVAHWPIVATEMAAALAGCLATKRGEGRAAENGVRSLDSPVRRNPLTMCDHDGAAGGGRQSGAGAA